MVCNRYSYCFSYDSPMITRELLEFYGVDDEKARDDFVAFLNGMLGFADESRKACWVKLCGALTVVMSEVVQLRGKNVQELETKQEELVGQVAELTSQVRTICELNERLNESNRERLLQIKKMETEIHVLNSNNEIAKSALLKTERELASERRKNGRGKQQSMETDQMPVEPTSLQDDGSSRVALNKALEQTKHEKETLEAENERLSNLVKSLTTAEARPVEPQSKGRASLDDLNRERKARAQIEAQLESVGKEALEMSQKYTEFAREYALKWESERVKFKGKIKELQVEIGSLKSAGSGMV